MPDQEVAPTVNVTPKEFPGFACEVCGKAFDNPYKRGQHRRWDHAKSMKKGRKRKANAVPAPVSENREGGYSS